MKRMQTLTCIVLALSLLLGLGLAGAQAESAGKIVVFQQKTEIYDQLVELAKAYQEETGVEVEVWPIAGDDYYQNLKTYMASESGPTVFTLNSASEIAEMSGYLADLSDLEVMGKVQENLIAMVDGKKTGVPMTAEGFGIIYNKDMVDPEAISTMDGLIAFIEEQKAAGVTGLGCRRKATSSLARSSTSPSPCRMILWPSASRCSRARSSWPTFRSSRNLPSCL